MRRANPYLAAVVLLLLGAQILLTRAGSAGVPERPLLAAFLPEGLAGLIVGEAQIARAPQDPRAEAGVVGWAVVSETNAPRQAKNEAVDRLLESIRAARILRRFPGAADSSWTRVALVAADGTDVLELRVGPEAPEGGTMIGIGSERAVVQEELWAHIRPPGGSWESGPAPAAATPAPEFGPR